MSKHRTDLLDEPKLRLIRDFYSMLTIILTKCSISSSGKLVASIPPTPAVVGYSIQIVAGGQHLGYTGNDPVKGVWVLHSRKCMLIRNPLGYSSKTCVKSVIQAFPPRQPVWIRWPIGIYPGFTLPRVMPNRLLIWSSVPAWNRP